MKTYTLTEEQLEYLTWLREVVAIYGNNIKTLCTENYNIATELDKMGNNLLKQHNELDVLVKTIKKQS